MSGVVRKLGPVLHSFLVRHGLRQDVCTVVYKDEGIRRPISTRAASRGSATGRWPSATITYSYDEDLARFSDRVLHASVREALHLALLRWEAGTALRFREARDADGDIRIRLSYVGALTQTRVKTTLTCYGSRLVRATIELDEHETRARLNRSESLVNLLTHAIGHAVGLGHCDDARAIMHPASHTARQSLAQADIHQVERMYGPTQSQSTGPKKPLHLGASARRELDDTTAHAPVLARLGDRVFLAWIGTDPKQLLNVMQLNLGWNPLSIRWTRKLTLCCCARSGLALAAFRGKLVLCWPDRRSHELHMIVSSDGLTWSDPVSLGVTSDSRPSLIEHEGKLFLAYTDSEQNIVIMSSHDGFAWSDKQVVPGAQACATSLASWRGRLHLGFEDLQHFVKLMASDDGGARWQRPVLVPAHCSGGPSLLVDRDALLIAWSDTLWSKRVQLVRSQDGSQLDPVQTLSFDSENSPSLVAADGGIVFAWTQVRAHRLHILLNAHEHTN